jgi:hypothetical protein
MGSPRVSRAAVAAVAAGSPKPLATRRPIPRPHEDEDEDEGKPVYLVPTQRQRYVTPIFMKQPAQPSPPVLFNQSPVSRSPPIQLQPDVVSPRPVTPVVQAGPPPQGLLNLADNPPRPQGFFTFLEQPRPHGLSLGRPLTFGEQMEIDRGRGLGFFQNVDQGARAAGGEPVLRPVDRRDTRQFDTFERFNPSMTKNESAYWVCVTCQFQNEIGTTRCQRCNQPKPPRYRLDGKPLEKLDIESNPKARDVIPGTRHTFQELRDALTIPLRVNTGGACGIHNAFKNFHDLPKALAILRESSRRTTSIQDDQLIELKKMLLELGQRIDDRAYVDRAAAFPGRITTDEYINRLINYLISKVIHYKGEGASSVSHLQIYKDHTIVSQMSLNDLLFDLMSLLRKLHPYFQAKWVASFIESNQKAYEEARSEQVFSCSDGIIERPLCIFAQELSLAVSVVPSAALLAEEENTRKKNQVTKWMDAFFSERTNSNKGLFQKTDEPELNKFLRKKISTDADRNFSNWESIIHDFKKTEHYQALLELEGKRKRVKHRSKRRSKGRFKVRSKRRS